jgi:hypothetical protein
MRGRRSIAARSRPLTRMAGTQSWPLRPSGSAAARRSRWFAGPGDRGSGIQESSATLASSPALTSITTSRDVQLSGAMTADASLRASGRRRLTDFSLFCLCKQVRLGSMRSRLTVALASLILIALGTGLASAGQDVRLVGPPRLEVICAIEYGDPGRVAYRTRPHECMFHKRFTPVASAFMVSMRGIRWTHWGPKVAIGKGKFLANMVGPTPGRVRLTHPLEICGHRIFTLAHFKFQGLKSSGPGLPLDRRAGPCR